MARRLTTIVITDVVGYSRLMADDETGTVEAVKAHQRQVINPLIESCGGRVVKLMGDGSMLEFASVVDSVRFAVLMQCAIAEDTQQITYRIGINIGDVIADGDDLFGDGVNIAARIEPLADPGGICLSLSAYKQIVGKLDIDFEAMGAHDVKNIPEPVEVWRIVMNDKAALIEKPDILQSMPATNRYWLLAATIASALLVIVGASFFWHSQSHQQKVTSSAEPKTAQSPPISVSQPGSGQGTIVPPVVIRENTLAVLPFHNLGGDAEIQYFSDGLSEDLTTDLSKVKGLTVISYASSFDYPNAQSGFKIIARELGVRYLVRGTVRHNGDRVRINVSLVDPLDGFNIWTDRYERARSNPFDVQEEVTLQIVNALSLTLETDKEELKKIDPNAYYMLLRGLEPLRELTASGSVRARVFFERALVLDPQYARAYASIAVSYGREMILRHSDEASEASVKKGLEAAITATILDPNIPDAYFAIGLLNLVIKEYDNALAAVRHAIKLDGNYSDGYALLAEVAFYGGDLNEALIAIKRAKLLHPHHPYSYDWI
ncbi:MAG: adenylate cyclase, partial [Gammaproteobacteria bacterium]